MDRLKQRRNLGLHKISAGAVVALAAGMLLLFIDETIRKLIGGGIWITAMKDILFLMLVTASFRMSRLPSGYSGALAVWLVVSGLSAGMVWSGGGGLAHLAATLKVYWMFVVYVVVGSLLARVPALLTKFCEWVALGATFAAIVAALQEHAPEVLPSGLNENNFREAHSMATGSYVEGTFGSPQTLSYVLVAGLVIILVRILRGEMSRSKLVVYQSLVPLLIYGIYIARIRTGAILGIGAVVLVVYCARDRINRLGWGAVCLCGVVIILAMSNDNLTASDESEFYIESARSERIEERFEAAFYLPTKSNSTLLGEGAGTSGRLRDLVGSQFPIGVPDYFDSGISQSVYQFGLVGGIMMIAMLAVPAIRSGLRLRRMFVRGESDLVAQNICCVVGVTWFALKQMSIIVNGASGFMLGVCIGISVSSTIRRGRIHRERLT